MEKLAIWGDMIPGNSSASKRSVMELTRNPIRISALDTIRWILTVRGGPFKDGKRVIDTYTDCWVKKTDPDYRECFEDVPYLLPFPAKGSDRAVIVVPGGGYCVKSMEGEGTEVARRLQANGITAFVLWYRTNPYYQPYPLMDMQRAVRWVRAHAADYGYAADRIGAVGFSAGGAQVALFLNLVHAGLIELPAYPRDAIDENDDSLQFAGLVYPALSYRFNETMMFASFPADVVRRESQRKALIEQYDVLSHMTSADIPQFISYGTKDDMVSVPEIEAYIRLLREAGAKPEAFPIEGAGHGYGAAAGKAQSAWLDAFISWVKAQ